MQGIRADSNKLYTKKKKKAVRRPHRGIEKEHRSAEHARLQGQANQHSVRGINLQRKATQLVLRGRAHPSKLVRHSMVAERKTHKARPTGRTSFCATNTQMPSPHPSLEANQCVAWGRCASIPWAHVLVDAEGNCWWTVLQHVSTNIRTRAVDVELAAAQTPKKWYASELRPPVLHETIAFTSQQAAATRPSKPFL